ncbi:MAG: SDR family oxidoreductase [Polyangia bacterium]
MIQHRDLTLVVGASGFLGMEVTRLLSGAGRPVRAAVRRTCDPERCAALESLGAEVVIADLKDSASLDTACRGVAALVATASAMRSRQERDSIQTVDELGNLALIRSAQAAGVGHFVFVSLPQSGVDYALQRAKRAVEDRLREAAISYTVLRPMNFFEAWLSPAFGFDPVQGHVRIFGNGECPISWISIHDVARFAVAASEGGRFADKVLEIGGPDPLSYLQILRIFEELGGPKVIREHVPEAAIEAQLSAARNPIEEAGAAIMLATARGRVVDPRPALEMLPGRLLTVRDYVTRLLRQ